MTFRRSPLDTKRRERKVGDTVIALELGTVCESIHSPDAEAGATACLSLETQHVLYGSSNYGGAAISRLCTSIVLS